MEEANKIKKEISKLKSLMYFALICNQKDTADQYRGKIIEKIECYNKLLTNIKSIEYKISNRVLNFH